MQTEYHPALNQPPVPNVGKTGRYFYTQGSLDKTLGRNWFHRPSTCYRAPADQGARLPYKIIPAILRAFRSRYAPHVGRKQLAKLNRRKA